MIQITVQMQTWREHTRVLIVADGVASVQLELWDKQQDFGGTVWLYALWVNEDSRRKGYARALLERAEQIAKQYGHDSIHMDWKEADTPREVLQWYMRCGYNDIAFSSKGDYVMLEKKLNENE